MYRKSKFAQYLVSKISQYQIGDMVQLDATSWELEQLNPRQTVGKIIELAKDKDDFVGVEWQDGIRVLIKQHLIKKLEAPHGVIPKQQIH